MYLYIFIIYIYIYISIKRFIYVYMCIYKYILHIYIIYICNIQMENSDGNSYSDGKWKQTTNILAQNLFRTFYESY